MAVCEAFGAEVAWHSEIDEAPAKILAHHYPHIPNLGDITKINWSEVEPVDIITGGSPCQDLSSAGKRAGMTEGTRSNLWHAMRDAIEVIKPKYVVWENVRGALSAKATSESDRKSNENHEYCLCSGPHRRGGEYSHRGDEGEVVCTSDDSRNDTASPGCDGGPSQGVRGNLEVVPEINGQMGGGVDVVRPRRRLQGSSGKGTSALEDKEGSRPDSPQGIEYPEQPSKKGERECEVDRGGSNGVPTAKSPSQGAKQEGSACDQCQECGGCLNEECPASDLESEYGQMGNLRALGRVLGDLAEIGYDTQWQVVRAGDIGAPHRRERVFVLGKRTEPSDS